jgi:hypothetical protein
VLIIEFICMFTTTECIIEYVYSKRAIKTTCAEMYNILFLGTCVTSLMWNILFAAGKRSIIKEHCWKAVWNMLSIYIIFTYSIWFFYVISHDAFIPKSYLLLIFMSIIYVLTMMLIVLGCIANTMMWWYLISLVQ